MSDTLISCHHCNRDFSTLAGLQKHTCKDRDGHAIFSAPQPLEIVTAASIHATLTATALSIAEHDSTIQSIAKKAHEDALLPALCIGLHCLKAHVLFCIPNASKRGSMKGKKSSSAADGLFPGGFEGWIRTLNEEGIKLSKGSAYNAMNAVVGLRLDADSSEKEVAAALAAQRLLGPVSIKSLCAAAAALIAPPAAATSNLQQTEFQFLKDSLSAYRKESETLLAIADQLRGMPEMHRAACARAYATLSALTGTNWNPSDTPDSLADVDPDSITL